MTVTQETTVVPEETGLEVPLERIAPDTLRKMIEEFVTREWSELADAEYPLDAKIEQVLSQLRNGQAKVVFDLETQTCNIIPSR
jgi:uncharacterized protein YheU (UPF0270 family)